MPKEVAAATFGEQFLRFPDLFPTRRSGEVWGEQALEIDFVGGPYRFLGLHEEQVQATQERFGELCREPTEDDSGHVLTTRLFRIGRSEFRTFELDGWTYTFDRDYTPTSVRLAGLDFMGRLDWADDLSGALFTGEGGGATFQCLFENFFRVLVAYRLLELGGVLLHSAGVASRGRAHLFLGPSGAGKTTISRLGLASGRLVLSDDMNALCPDEEGTPKVEKLPFAGDLGRTPTPRSTYPLASLNRLRQGENHLRPLARAEAVATLLSCAPFVNSDPHRLDVLVDNLRDLVGRCQFQELTFSKKGDFWPLLENEI